MSNQGYLKLPGNSSEIAACGLHSLTQESKCHSLIFNFKAMVTYLWAENTVFRIYVMYIFFSPGKIKQNVSFGDNETETLGLCVAAPFLPNPKCVFSLTQNALNLVS